MNESSSNIINSNKKEYQPQLLNANIDNEITLYPSNWLYNASVIGFLKVIDAKYYFIDGGIKLNLTNFNDENWYKSYIEHSFEMFSFKEKDIQEYTRDGKIDFDGKIKLVVNKRLFFQNGLYTNLVTLVDKNGNCQKTIKSLKEKFHWLKNDIKYNNKVKRKKLIVFCSTCNNKYTIEKKDFKNFTFRNKFMSAIGGAIDNFFWNNTPNVNICKRCAFFFIHSHLSFSKIKNGQMFINAPSFKLMWLLNKYADEVISKNESLENSQILGLSLMQLAQKISFTLGAWSIMNIEMIIKRRNEIDYFTIPYNITKVLLNKDIASLIQQSGEFYIFNIVLSGRFDMLLKLNNAILRVLCGSSRENSLIKELYKSDNNSLRRLANILPELYIKIEKTQTRRD